MNSAIVTGGFGRLGAALVKALVSRGVRTLCVGRLPDADAGGVEVKTIDDLLTNVRLPVAMLRDGTDAVPLIAWKPHGECVLYNLAWGRLGRLTTSSVSLQVSCVEAVSAFVTLAKALGCVRFVEVGSQQERFVDDFLQHDWCLGPYPTDQGVYGVAKLIARDLGAVLCYLNHVDFVNVRFSTYIDESLEGGGYVASSLRSILGGRAYPAPQSGQWCEILPIAEVVRALVLIGGNGKNKADYYIGTKRPRTIAEYFRYFELAVSGTPHPEVAWTSSPPSDRDRSHFDPDSLLDDVGFRVEDDFEAFARRCCRT